MKSKGIYINTFLGILMLVANLLPALHAHEHFYSLDSDGDQITTEITEKISKPAVNCDLCDFNFSSTNEPVVFSCNLHLPDIYRLQISSITESIYLFPQPEFSLRAPPVATA